MPQLGIEQQLVLITQRLGSHVRTMLREGDLAGARAELDDFGAYVYGRLKQAQRARTEPPPPNVAGLTEPPPASGELTQEDYEDAADARYRAAAEREDRNR